MSPLETDLEAMIDKHGVANVLHAIADVMREKAEHLASNWQDKDGEKAWQKSASRVDRCAGFAHWPL